ncbi:MAG TPA: hypothetical protein VG944_11835 [Fimbriimonas sp.]|nr:hypothetical protein [Fimbriimonas sp.]
MKQFIPFAVVGVAVLLAGCGSNDAAKPSTTAEVTQFKGNPKSPNLQKVLKAHFAGGGPPPPPPAAGR